MAATLSCPAASASASITTYLRSRSRSRHHKLVIFVPNRRQRNIYEIRCNAQKNPKGNSNPNPTSNSNSSTTGESEPENMLLKMAWYGSELLGIAASLFRSSSSNYNKVESEATPAASIVELSKDEFGVVDRAAVVENIKDDFQRSYFVTGNLTLPAYEEDCEFADPAGSFRGLRRFKRNCSNFGLLLERSNMKLMKWEDFEDKGIGHWRFSCTLVFPWKPILSATGYTEYYFDLQSGKVCRHVEHWNVPKKALFKQILRPTRGLWSKKKAGS